MLDKDIFKGIKIAFGMTLFFGLLFGLVYAVGFHVADEVLPGTFGPGNYSFGTSQINFTESTVIGLDAIPSSSIMAFNLSVCPTGWSNYTLAYGRFLRGIDFTNSTTIDPDGQRALGDIQNDTFESHVHGGILRNSAGAIGLAGSPAFQVDGSTYDTSATGDSETRPDNVAVLYCIKD